MPIPFDPQTAITTAASQNGVDPALALAIAQQGEGGGHFLSNDAVSPRGARGIMQLMPDTARGLNVDPSDPGQNVLGGVRYIRQLQDQFGASNPDLIAAAYNAGPGNAAKFGRNWGAYPVPGETGPYVTRITGALNNDAMPDQGSLDAAFGVGQPQANRQTDTGGPGVKAGVTIENVHPATKEELEAAAAEGEDLPDQGSLDAAFGVRPPGPTSQQPAQPPTTAGAARAFGSGLLGTVMNAANLAANPNALLGSGIDLGERLTTLGAENAGLITPTQQQNANTMLLGGRQQYLGPTTQEQQNALGLYYQPRNAAERLFETLGAAAPAAPAGIAPLLGGVAGSFGGSEIARALGAPPEVQTLAGFLGGMGGGLGAEGVRTGVGAAGDATAPFRAGISQGAAETQAARKLAGAAIDVGAVRNALANTPYERVPGSVPTTPQLTGDTGLLAMEKGAQSRSPELFTQRAADQNRARVQALQAIQQGGDAADVGRLATEHLDAIDRTTQAAIDQATQKAQAAAPVPGAPPESQGADLRAAITEQQTASKAAYGALYRAVDPDGTLTANVQQTKAAARDIPAAEPAMAKDITGEEASIYKDAQGMPDVAPARELMALKVRVNEAAAQANRNGETASYARLSRLREALNQNISTTISDKVAADDAAVSSGQMPAQTSARAQLEAAIEDARSQGLSVSFGRAAGAGGAGSARAAPIAGGGGAASAPGGQPAGPAGNSPGAAGPTFDAAAAARLKAADVAYAQHAQTFGVRPVSGVTRTNGYGGQFTLPDGSVPGKFFHSGPSGFNDMQAALKAGGDQALGVLQDYAATSLRNAAMRPDGTIDPVKFAAWQKANADALRALPPETQARFADAASAGEAVSAAAAARNAAMADFKKSALGRLIGVNEPQDVTRTVATILNGRTAVRDMNALADAAQSNPAAMNGLRQAVADHITSKLIGNTEAGTTGVPAIKSDQLQTFVRQSRPALSKVFKPEELDTLDAIAADLQQANRSNTAVKLPSGSDTTQKLGAVAKFFKEGGPRIGVDYLGSLAGEALGRHLGIPFGEQIGQAFGGLTTDALQQLRSRGITRVNDLVTQALLNPEVAKRLLAKVPDDPAARTAGWKAIADAVGRGATVGAFPAITPRPQRRSALGKPVAMRPTTNALQGVSF